MTTIQRKIDRAAWGRAFSPERTEKTVCRGCKNMTWNRFNLRFTSVLTSLHFWPWLYSFHQGAGLPIEVRLFEVKRVKAIKFYISDGFSNRQGFFIALIFLLKHLKWGQHINQPATTNKSAWMKAQAARVGGDLTADVKLSKRWRENYSIVGFTPGKKKKNSIWSAVKLG